MLKKVISIIMISISIIILFYNNKQINDMNNTIDEILEDKKINAKYDGYIYIPSLYYRQLIKKGEYNNILNNNLVLMISDKKVINKEYGNIILAGHNNKYVFNILYKLKENDEIIISDFKNTYSYTVYKIMTVNIKDTYILDNVYDDKILTLITCTNNNQKRFVVICKINHIISHN